MMRQKVREKQEYKAKFKNKIQMPNSMFEEVYTGSTSG